MIPAAVEELLRFPPESVKRLASVSRNMGELPLHELVAFMLGYNVTPEEVLRLRMVFNRAPRSMIREAAEALGMTLEAVEATAAVHGMTIPALTDAVGA